MWGMCRDKYGSAVVAGFFKALDILKPKNVKVSTFSTSICGSMFLKLFESVVRQSFV